MKNVSIIGILAVAILFTGCRSTPKPETNTSQVVSPPSSANSRSNAPIKNAQSPIDLVRNGYFKSHKTTTIGQALEGTFQNGKWSSFTTQKGVTVVEFDGNEPFKDFNQPWSTNDLEGAQAAVYLQTACAQDEECSRFIDHLSKICDGDQKCFAKAAEDNANQPIPIKVLFTINLDSTFQYNSSSIYDQQHLIRKMYDEGPLVASPSPNTNPM